MKGSKLVSLDIEIMRKLALEDNASALINGLLVSYFEQKEGINTSNLHQIRQEIKQKREKLHQIKGILRAQSTKEANLKDEMRANFLKEKMRQGLTYDEAFRRMPWGLRDA